MFIFKNIKELPIKYYGNGDLAGGFFVKYVIDNIDIISENIDKINEPITNQNELYQYLWSISFAEMIKEIDCYNVEATYKKRLIELSNKIDIGFGRVIKYINENYEIVFSKENNNEIIWHKYFKKMIEICYKICPKSINKKVFKYIENLYQLEILTLFDYCDAYFKNHRNEFESLFDGLRKTMIYDDKIYVSFLLKQRNREDSFLKEKASFICNRVIDDIKKHDLSDDDPNLIQIMAEFEIYYNLANYYELVCYNEFSDIKNAISKKLDSYLFKHGKKLKMGPIDLSPAINILKTTDSPYKFFQISHKMADEKYINSFDDILIDRKDRSLTDIFPQIGKASSEKYPYSKQDSMEIFMFVYANILNNILLDENLCGELSLFINTVTDNVERIFFNNRINISKEINGEFESILFLINLTKDNKKDISLYKSILNGCVMNICGTIEKIIRNIVLQEKKNISYFNNDTNALGKLLKSDISSLSKGLIYFLNYYLCAEYIPNSKKSDRPGKNIRNIQMHNYDDKFEKTDEYLCLELFYFVINLLNDIILKNNELWQEDLHCEK